MQCSPTSVGLAQAHPNKSISKNQNKTKQNGKKRWGPSSNSAIKKASNCQVQRLLNFEYEITHTCIQPQRVSIPLGTWLEDMHLSVSFRSPGRECSQSPAATPLHIHWYHSLSNLTVSLFCHWRGKLCHVCSILKWLAVLFERRKAKALASF